MKLMSSFPRVLLVAACCAASVAVVHAQARIGIGGNTHTIRSPEVGTDNRVTFRLLAPGAQSVNLLSDFTAETIAMKKDALGMWSFSTEALKPPHSSVARCWTRCSSANSRWRRRKKLRRPRRLRAGNPRRRRAASPAAAAPFAAAGDMSATAG